VGLEGKEKKKQSPVALRADFSVGSTRARCEGTPLAAKEEKKTGEGLDSAAAGGSFLKETLLKKKGEPKTLEGG